MANNKLKLSSSDTHFENILAYYLDTENPEEVKLKSLSEADQKLKNRWETAFTALLEFRSPEDAVKRLMTLFGVSKATAYRDVQRCEMLFGSFKRFDKEAWRYISIERKHKLYQLALKDKNIELAYKIDKEIDSLLGLKDQDSPIDLEKIQAQDYDIIMSKKQERLIKQILSSGGAVNMNVPNTIDIDFEEIKRKEDGEA
ncbi:hypothetical protein [Zunongwangia profunda]|uniref:hypothetical protein n=1 Tax=Zunongwangia profunda TaxID=398743 RepID=UPI001D18CE20|nr:hypothetical protein [Zunongwangia profunda]MCC4228383.1 hypothetical protein [Zunongwangia profunda]